MLERISYGLRRLPRRIAFGSHQLRIGRVYFHLTIFWGELERIMEPSPEKSRLSECVNFVWERGGPCSAKTNCRELPSQTQFNSCGFQCWEILQSAARGLQSAVESSWPLAKTILLRCISGLPSLEGLPIAVISSPDFSVSLLQPALASMPGAPNSMRHSSTAPFSFFTSR